MSYNLTLKKNPRYYSDLEIEELKHKKKIPFSEYSRVGTRRAFHIPERVRQKDEVVNYKDNFAIVRKITKNGIYIEKFKRENGFDVPSGKLTFITNKEAEHTLYPAIENPKYMVGDLIF